MAVGLGVELDGVAQRAGQRLEAALGDVVGVGPVEGSRCTQAPQFMAKAWWNSLNSSVSMSPTLGVLKSTFQIR